MIIHRFISAQIVNDQNPTNRLLIVCFALLLTGTFVGCASEAHDKDEVVVFAAASLQDPMREVANSFEAEHGVSVRLNFASSGALAQQIIAGGRADVFVSASKNWFEQVSRLGAAADGSVRPLCSNSLVVVAHKSTDWQLDSIEELDALPFRYLVIGDPDFVPAGRYAKEFLNSVSGPRGEVSLWNSMGKRICPTADLRRVLALVESDRSLAGVVYETDVLKSRRVRVIHQVPRANASVDYFLVTMESSQTKVKRRDLGSEFRRHVFSKIGTDIFLRHGFTVAGQSN